MSCTDLNAIYHDNIPDNDSQGYFLLCENLSTVSIIGNDEHGNGYYR